MKNKKVRERILRSVKENREITSKGMMCRHISDFPAVIMEARGDGITLRGEKKTSHPAIAQTEMLLFPIEGKIKAFS